MTVVKSYALAFGILLAGAGIAFALDTEARYGGRVEHIGKFHVELVVKGKAVEAFLIGGDHKPMKSDGYKGLAILVVSGKSERVALSVSQSRDNNLLSGASAVELPAKPRGVVQITTPEGRTLSARFD